MATLETELYEPVAAFLREKGCKVRSEVKGCDVAALKGDTLIIVELKLKFNMTLLMQAVERLSVTDYVYVAIPRPAVNDKNTVSSRNYKSMLKILKRLQIGLLLVALDSPVKTVEPVLHPMEYVFRGSRVSRLNIIKELDSRVGDFNTGGSSRAKIITAYKEKSIQIACIINEVGSISTKDLRLKGITQRELQILIKNYYGWFERVRTGVYKLTEEGNRIIKNPEPQYKKIVAHYSEVEQ